MSVNVPLGPLLDPAFHLGQTPTSWAELLGFGTGVVTVWFVVRQNILNWPLGLANVILLGLVFLDSGLYADAGLQIVYVALQAYGWWQWLHGGRDHGPLAVTRTTRAEWAALLTAGALTAAALTWLLSTHTDSTVPFWDATTTAISLMATYGQCRKRLESWWLWITADLIYIPLYAHKGLHLTSGLYVIFLGLCVLGLLSWRADLRIRTTAAPAGATA
ncbi:nicotinamide riboside transporter PnuC [Actinomadura craniellae]|uniref:Nicotinamide riboside transporter PnuC n=1 Tax=Actinomadura craniellae TaxID=2231787 RepID=A0A365H340_9ACTN|nr:nicotinamide riboside transporter PnuC [Actinomadura craniellae]RAY13517.1 nicotinamide riboside transporter PnuC [Actinomadura craniellae]